MQSLDAWIYIHIDWVSYSVLFLQPRGVLYEYSIELIHSCLLSFLFMDISLLLSWCGVWLCKLVIVRNLNLRTHLCYRIKLRLYLQKRWRWRSKSQVWLVTYFPFYRNYLLWLSNRRFASQCQRPNLKEVKWYTGFIKPYYIISNSIVTFFLIAWIYS